MKRSSTWRTLEAARPGNAGSRLTNLFTTMTKTQTLKRPPLQRHLLAPTPTAIPSANTNKNSMNKPALNVISINIEGFSNNKAQLLANLCKNSLCDILCVQETHRDINQLRPEIPGMILTAEIPHSKYGSAIFVRPKIAIQSTATRSDDSIETITVDTGSCTVTSIYKPPKQPFHFNTTSNFYNRPIKIIVGDFNSHSTAWGYKNDDADGNAVEEWAEAENLVLIHNAKLSASFNSRRWRRGYNPDLMFTSDNVSKLCKKTVHQPIPRTQHRPIACCIESVIKPQIVPFRRRFNFSKANWELFSDGIDARLLNIDPIPCNYQQFVDTVWTVSRQHIPRGCCTAYVPGLNKDSASLLAEYESSYNTDPFSEQTLETGEALMREIGESRKQKWMTLVTEVDMTRNSKKAWQTIQKLTGDPPAAQNPGQVTADQVAHQLLLNGKPPHRLPKTRKLSVSADDTADLSKPFTMLDVKLGIKAMKKGKAAGFDDITVDQIKHLGPIAVSWILALFNSCLKDVKIPLLWRRAKVIALLKPGKCPKDPKSYRPISLLCHTFKLFERLLLNRLTPIIEPNLIAEQAGFRPGKSCTNQTLKLTQHIENGFEVNNVTGVVFVDLSAAYDTVNIKRLLLKVNDLTKDIGFVHILSEILNNRRFQVHLNNNKSRWRCQKNGLPQGSVLAPALFNVYTNDQPCTALTQRFLYADDLALAAQTSTFKESEDILTEALITLGKFYDENALRPNPSKTQSCAFHLRNSQSDRTLNISWQGVAIEHCNQPRYLGITLDRSLTYRPHCVNTKLKVSTRNNLLRRLTSTSWGATPHVLRTTALSLAYSAGEFACPVWHRSTHAKEVDIALNDTCRIVTGCLKPTPLNKLYPLAGIAPPDVRRETACRIEKRKQEVDNRHPLYDFHIPRARLKSRKSFLRYTTSSEESAMNIKCELWRNKHPPPLQFIAPKEHLPPGSDLQWPIWKSLNRLRTQVGRCRKNLAKWGIIDPTRVPCNCGAPIQDMPHLLSCPLCTTNCTMEDLNVATNKAIEVATYWSRRV